MKSKYLFMFLGYPGSGKTYFSEQLAKKTAAVRINADAMRVAAFGTIEKAKEFDKSTGQLNMIVFGILDYVAAQVLKSGNSAICDYQHNEKSFRTKREQLAKENDAYPIIVWVKTPRDIAVKRGSDRDESLDQRQHAAKKMEVLVDKYIGLMELPGDDEKTIIIDGTLPFEQQYVAFIKQLKNLVNI